MPAQFPAPRRCMRPARLWKCRTARWNGGISRRPVRPPAMGCIPCGSRRSGGRLFACAEPRVTYQDVRQKRAATTRAREAAHRTCRVFASDSNLSSSSGRQSVARSGGIPPRSPDQQTIFPRAIGFFPHLLPSRTLDKMALKGRAGQRAGTVERSVRAGEADAGRGGTEEAIGPSSFDSH